MQKIIQCVPNFSEGRNLAVIESIVGAMGEASAARLADYSFDPDHNRLVVTILGGPEEVRQSMIAGAEKAVELIDLRVHSGAHPRIGAIDVVPLVPIRGVTMRDCIDLSYRIGRDIAEKLGVPVYYYEKSATATHRTNLPDVRRGGFEKLLETGLNGDRAPDAGPSQLHPSAGATVVGARDPLVAYNINLATQDMEIARSIASKIRNSELGLKGVRSLSVWLATRSLAQVSMNVTRPAITPISDVFSYVESEAHNHGVEVAQSEIIGLVSRRFLGSASPQDLKAFDFKDTQLLETWL